jgi:hypothetical protein
LNYISGFSTIKDRIKTQQHQREERNGDYIDNGVSIAIGDNIDETHN